MLAKLWAAVVEELAAMDLEKQIQKREMDMKEAEKAPG